MIPFGRIIKLMFSHQMNSHLRFAANDKNGMNVLLTYYSTVTSRSVWCPFADEENAALILSLILKSKHQPNWRRLLTNCNCVEVQNNFSVFPSFHTILSIQFPLAFKWAKRSYMCITSFRHRRLVQLRSETIGRRSFFGCISGKLQGLYIRRSKVIKRFVSKC